MKEHRVKVLDAEIQDAPAQPLAGYREPVIAVHGINADKT